MKTILCSVIGVFMLILNARADYTLIVPSPKGTGTAIWADVVASELTKYLHEPINVINIKGGKGNLGLEVFKEKYKNDPKAILLTHGGNAEQWLINDVNWSFKDWIPIMIQPYNITTTIAADFDWVNNELSLADCSGCVPETLAWAMLKGWREINFIRKMGAKDAQLAWLRGNLKYIREPASRHIKNTKALVDKGEATRLFNHGIYTVDGFIQDHNWPNTPTVIDLYKQTYNASPTGYIYDAYVLVSAWRDGLQKGLFVHPIANHKKIISAFHAMIDNKQSREYLISKLGDYPMFVGKDSNAIMDSLYAYVTPRRLNALVYFARTKMQWSTAKYVNDKTK
jgi:hypothetical protein